MRRGKFTLIGVEPLPSRNPQLETACFHLNTSETSDPESKGNQDLQRVGVG